MSQRPLARKAPFGALFKRQLIAMQEPADRMRKLVEPVADPDVRVPASQQQLVIAIRGAAADLERAIAHAYRVCSTIPEGWELPSPERPERLSDDDLPGRIVWARKDPARLYGLQPLEEVRVLAKHGPGMWDVVDRTGRVFTMQRGHFAVVPPRTLAAAVNS
jgi:hypothetical protein